MTPRTRWLLLSFSLVCHLASPAQQTGALHSMSQNLMSVDASAPFPAPETDYLHMGGSSSTGHSLQVNSRYLTLDGKPWLPIMGEMHYSRVPESEWEGEILKMKAGGVDIVSTYVFWIHHEEVEGQFDWSGRRNLRHFIELCAKHRMYVYLRPGPWAHGEVRNGGFPDWLVKLPKTRTNDPVYLAHVASFFNQVGDQLKGLMFKDGGPIIGTQLENEYGQHGADSGAEHILKLKELALAAGIDPPLFSVTGWPSLDFPPQAVIPVSGGYPDGFWYGSQAALPPSMNYLFNLNRELGDMGATVPTEDPTGKVDLKHYPDFAAEEAGGMASSYHRRPVLTADDIAALTLTGIGSGVNLYGYYMFHGGANPAGKLTTLQESQATGFPNDLPEISYDFQAPLGEFGQVRNSYRKTRVLHLFVNAFGAQLAPMQAFGPAIRPKGAADTSVPRVAVRTDGNSGFVFVNNYGRQLAMPVRNKFQVNLKLRSGELLLPQQPVDVPSGAYFIWPVNLYINGARLEYSTAQVLTKLETSKGAFIVFFAVPSVLAEFSFDAHTISHITANGGRVVRRDGRWMVDNLSPGMNSKIEIVDRQGKKATIVVLSSQQAEQCSVLHLHDQDYLALSTSDVFHNEDQIHLRSTQSPHQKISLLPALAVSDGQTPSTPVRHGVWTTYSFDQPTKKLHLTATAVRIAAPSPSMKMGPYVEWRKASVPQVPTQAAFANSAEWQLRLDPPDMHGLSDVLLQIDYVGDVGQVAANSNLLDDNFFNGQPWQIGLRRFAPSIFGAPIQLDLLPMPSNSPIYLDDHARAILAQHQPTPSLLGVKLIPEYETVLTITAVHRVYGNLR